MRRITAARELDGRDHPAPATPHPSAIAGRDGAPKSAELSLIELQRTAGNAAVTQSIRDLVVQRDPKRKKARPKWAEEAKQSLRELFPKDKLMEAVEIEDYGETNAALKDFEFGAWTNSKTLIYLRSPSAFADPDDPKAKDRPKQAMLAALHHESQHVRQFARDGGPPKSWEQMLRYEQEAYGLDKTWLTGDGAKVITNKKLRDELVAGATKELDIVVRLLAGAKTLKADTKEATLRQQMIDELLIPTASPKDPGDMYKQPAL